MATPPQRKSRRGIAVAAGLLGLIAVAGVVAYASGFVNRDRGLEALAVGEMAGLTIAETPTPSPALPFTGPDGGETTFTAFEGQVAVVNLWAMWCAPCREEMPTLAALQKAYDPGEVVVAAINVDGDPAQEAPARAFLAEHAPLAFYREAGFRLPFELPGAGAMPQTVLIDREGRIRAWKTGAADWSSPEARAVIDALRAE
ncbi:TlpA family protein disulfide reductase [Brevundimonas lutea]|uniref:TlpA family protein disulfide reductase n=1 Tax=Brevundimonas lutea TaxID=2293980 RepID=UPI000F023E5C|nr:TlpA disulfide reductase family protein [Brevundimonas lutea]